MAAYSIGDVPSRNALSAAVLSWGAVAAIVALLVVREPTPTTTQTLTYIVAVVPMLAALGWAVLRRDLWARGAWAIIFVVLDMHVVGLLIRQFTQDGQRSPNLTSAGAADAVFASAYATALLAFLLMVRRVRRRPEPLWTIDALLVFLAVWTMGAQLILAPLELQGANWLALSIQAFYLTVNAALIGLGVRLGLTTAKGVNRALRLGLLAVSLYAVNDIVSTAGIVTDTQVGIRNGIYTAVNIVVITLAAAAATDPTARNAPVKTPHEGRLAPVRSVAAVLVTFALVGLVLFQYKVTPDKLANGLLFFVASLVVLLAARNLALVQAYRQIVDRESRLRAATEAMRDADSVESIDREFGAATRDLLPDDVVTWHWRERDGALGADGSPPATVVLNEAPGPDTGDSLSHYRYGFAIGGDELSAELVAPLLLDPLDWSGVQALVEMATQSRSRQRLREERELSAKSARTSAMLAGAQDMVLLIEEDCTIAVAVGAVQELTGHSPDYWVNRPLASLFEEPQAVIASAKAGGLRRQRVSARLQGTGAIVEVTVVRFESGEVTVSLHDVTARVELARELERRAHHDDLTGLPNRTRLEILLAEHGRLWRDGGPAFSVVYLDIDDFKVVNDSLGPRMGDALLRALAVRLSTAVGQRGTVARLGGDEFAVLLPDCDLNRALGMAECFVQNVLFEPLSIDGLEILIRVSAGVATSEDRVRGDGVFVLQAADLALYDARAKGKGQVAPFRVELVDSATRKLHDANAVTAAAREGAFRFDYQPIVQISGSNVVAMEALMRWDLGEELRRPDAFIPIAESLGELTRMLRDVLPTALVELKRWREELPTISLAINVHSGALGDPEFVRWFTSAIQAADLPLDSVIVEVSERTLVSALAESNVAQLRAEGLQIWIDDFGTGWSNLSSLERLPVTGVKLARELVVDDTGEVKTQLVSAVLQLADAVGFVVTAEGVETAEQVQCLADMGVAVVQGFLIARPMAADDAYSWLVRYRDTTEAVGLAGELHE